MNISVSTAWRIVRNKLKWYPYKPRTVVPLTEQNKAGRVVFCDWQLKQPQEFEQKLIWSDIKWFVLK